METNEKYFLNQKAKYSTSPMGEVSSVEPIEYESEEELFALLSSGSESLKQFLEIIDKVKNSEAQVIGQGVYKKVYGIGDKAISFMKEKHRQSSLSFNLKNFNSEQQILNELAKRGVNVPTSFFTYFDKVENSKLMDFYHIDERLPGKCLLFYNFNSENFMHFIGNSLSESFNNSEHPIEPSEEDLINACLKYNLQMAQHRALTGQKFLSKLFRDYSILANLDFLGDCHSENIHYCSKSGYWFMDLGIDSITANSIQNIGAEKYLDRSMKNARSENNIYFIERLIQSIGIENISHIKKPSDAFAQYVYNGILLQQLENALINNYPADLQSTDQQSKENKHSRDIKIRNIFHEYKATSEKTTHSIVPFETTCKLEQAIRENNLSLLVEYKDIFDLPYNYNFSSELNLPILHQAINNTISQVDSKSSPMAGKETHMIMDNSKNISFEME